MSIGVNQLLNAASYFILAYYMTEAKGFGEATCKATWRVLLVGHPG